MNMRKTLAPGNKSVLAKVFGPVLPMASELSRGERWRSVLGSLFGILVAGVVTLLFSKFYGFEFWLAAPLGASAVLVFAAYTSPMAQPWAVIVGNTISAAVGILCARYIPETSIAAAVAVSGAIGIMFLCRCLHPPGGASALLAVLIHATDLSFAFVPMMINSVLLVATGIFFSSLVGRKYPVRQTRRFGAAEEHAGALGEIRCREVMAHQFLTIGADRPIDEALEIMRSHALETLTVTDGHGRIAGIVTLVDFVSVLGDRAHTVATIMTKTVATAHESQPLRELMQLFSQGRHRSVPVIDGNKVVVGLITRTDFFHALRQSVRPAAPVEVTKAA